MDTGELDRRNLIKSLAAGAAILTGVARLPVSVAAQGGFRRVIDVHCHVFNGKDVPARAFVRTVVLENYPEQIDLGRRSLMSDTLRRIMEGAADWVVAGIEGTAPSIAQERDCIERNRCTWWDILIGRRSAEQGQTGYGPSLEEEMLEDYERLKAGVPRKKFFKGDEWKDRTDNLDALVERMSEPQPGEPRSLDAQTPGLEAQARRSLAARRLADPLSLVGPTLDWGRLLMSYRRTIIERYLATYNNDGYQTVLFAPALVDFTNWLPGGRPERLKEQVELMDLLARGQKSTRMHGYVGFDPLRQVRAAAQGALTPLDLAKAAVEYHGFLGVKLYSPMGFQPLGNDKIRLWPKFANVEQDFGRKLDDALISVYEWANAESVPILAHAMNSQAANIEYGKRAHPMLWREPLKRYPNLRLNLAHFGHFKPTSVPSSDIKTSWEWSIGALIKEGHEHVYADLSYFSVLLGSEAQNHALKRRTRNAMTRWIAEFDPQCRRLLYGTDWSMIARERQNEDYPKQMEDFLRSVGLGEAQLENIFFLNAVRYFGLGPGEPARQRLERYYQQNGIALAHLKKFDYQ